MSKTVSEAERRADAAWAEFFCALCLPTSRTDEVRALMREWERWDSVAKLYKQARRKMEVEEAKPI